MSTPPETGTPVAPSAPRRVPPPDAASPPAPAGPVPTRPVVVGALAMAAVVYASNRLVEIPINDWLTWGAFSYPVAFLVTDLVNRRAGPRAAMRVVWAGFALGVALSLALADARIALASGTAFLVAQSLDVRVFDALRGRAWWLAPGASSVAGSALDTALFFSIAFAGSGLPWVQWAVGDLAVKLAMACLALGPYRLLAGRAGGPAAAPATPGR